MQHQTSSQSNSGLSLHTGLPISFGRHRQDANWQVMHLTWVEFVERLRKVRRTSETMAHYDAMSKNDKGMVKDGPAFVGGLVRGGRRKKGSIESRSLITLDVDFADDGFIQWAKLMVLGGVAHVIYSTHSHRPGAPKFRLIILLDRILTPDEYSAVARKLAESIGMHFFDRTTFDVNRLMYLPSCSMDADPVFVEETGAPLNVDNLLAQYDSWTDPATWPRHPEDKPPTPFSGRTPQDPREKRGVVGQFCRAYPIEKAIDSFLSEIYQEGSMANRYTYLHGSSGNGLEVFPDQELAYSHQDSDPVADGHSHNAFDLVRIHLFGHLDEDIPEGTPVDTLPSHLEMAKLAMGLEEVKQLIQEEGAAEIREAFEDGFNYDVSSDEDPSRAAKLDLSRINIPSGFEVIDGRIFEVKVLKNGDVKHMPVCECLVAVTSQYTNLTDHTQGLEVSWISRTGIKSVSDTRSTFADSKKLINLSDYGLPVHSENARKLAAYLSRFESENEDKLTTRKVSNQLGWVKGGFLLGDSFIGEGDIQFMPKDAGDGQIARGFRTRGTMAGTLEMLERVKPFGAVKMAVYAALSAPLLSIWGESPYIFELAGSTSRGKTTALRIAASLWGCPDEHKPGIFRQWNMTKVAIERYAATMNHLPLFLDDTKKTDERTVRPIVFQFSSGQGKGRGSLRGAQASAGWQTVMLSTGEQKLTSFAKDGGSVGRVLSLEGSPFTSADVESAVLVQELNKKVSEHYGHIAEPWIRFLMTADMTQWQEKFASAHDRYLHLGSSAGEVAMRLSRIMAFVDVTGQMFDTCFGTNLYMPEDLQRIWVQITGETPEMDRAAEALDVIMGWVAVNNRQFMVNGSGSPYSGKLFGDIRKDEIFVIDDLLDEHLRSRGYEPISISKSWKEKGWTKTAPGRTKWRRRLGGGNPWTYCFDLTKLGWSFDINDRMSEFMGS